MSDLPTKRKLKINLSELDFAFEQAGYDISHYLDLETGAVAMVTSEIRSQLEDLYEEYYDEENESIDLPAVLETVDLHDWQKEALLEADRIEEGLGERFIAIPGADSHEGYRDMEEFLFTVQNSRLSRQLEYALHGRGPFRRFKDVLLNFPAERQRWFAFQQARVRERVLEWLEDIGIEPVE